MDIRTCSACRQEYPLTEEHFYRNKGEGFKGYGYKCKPCCKEYYKAHKEQRLAYEKERERKGRELVHQLKARTPCADCGNVFSPECMDFDHTEDNKVKSVSRLYGHPKALLIEIAKCELVCANCHRTRTKNRLYPPGTPKTG